MELLCHPHKTEEKRQILIFFLDSLKILSLLCRSFVTWFFILVSQFAEFFVFLQEGARNTGVQDIPVSSNSTNHSKIWPQVSRCCLVNAYWSYQSVRGHSICTDKSHMKCLKLCITFSSLTSRNNPIEYIVFLHCQCRIYVSNKFI